jgi:aspartyl-tRNA(Asn)/glutamyl-tRNA(Gln) amidotransferase subunit B
MGLSPYDAHVLTLEKETAAFYEIVAEGARPEDGGQLGDRRLLRRLNRTKREHRRLACQRRESWRAAGPDQGRHAVRQAGQGGAGGDVRDRQAAVRCIVEERGLKQVTDTGAIEKIIDEVMAKNADKVAEYRAARTSCSASLSARP